MRQVWKFNLGRLNGGLWVNTHSSPTYHTKSTWLTNWNYKTQTVVKELTFALFKEITKHIYNVKKKIVIQLY